MAHTRFKLSETSEKVIKKIKALYLLKHDRSITKVRATNKLLKYIKDNFEEADYKKVVESHVEE